MKYLAAGLFALVLLMGGLLLLEKADDVVNGPPPADVQSDSLFKRFTRAFTNWAIDKGMRDTPPESKEPAPVMALTGPQRTLSDFLIEEDATVDHSEGW